MGKKKQPMNIDTAPFWHFIVAAIVTVVILIVAIIVGATGPDAKESFEKFTYECKDKSHVWNSSECTGKQLGTRGVTYSVYTRALVSTNRFWGLKMVPYNKNVAGGAKHGKNKKMTIEIYANVSYRNDLRGAWRREVENSFRRVTVECPVSVKAREPGPEAGECQGFTLAYDRGVDHKYHQVTFEMIVAEQSDLALGDVGAHIYTGTTAYSNMQMGVNIFYLIVSLGVFLVYAWMLRDLIFRGWSFEQAATLLLTLAVILYNNPFFALEYLLPGMFFIFFDALVKSAFLALVLLYWLFSFDKIRVGEESFRVLDKIHIFKVAAVVACLVLGVITFTWAGIRDKIDPIFGSPFSSPGVITFYAFTAMTLVLIIAWVIIVAVMSIPVATASKQIFTRYCFNIISSAIVALSIIIGIFCGDFGTNNDNCTTHPPTHTKKHYTIFFFVLFCFEHCYLHHCLNCLFTFFVVVVSSTRTCLLYYNVQLLCLDSCLWLLAS